MLGEFHVTRGNDIIPSSLSILTCGNILIDDQCYDWDSFLSTCGSEKNVAVTSASHRAVTIFGVIYRGSTSNRKSCDAPPGGPGGAGPVCYTEALYVEISNDGGLTWTTVWTEYVDVCS